jgi:biopolymer transport protein ExbD
MAEMNVAQQGGRKGSSRSTKKSTRVDMTPMVDLGFLLITFFMLTTALTQPKTMDLLMPRNDGPQMPLPESKALTILLGADNRIAYYEGMGNNPAMPPQIKYASFANTQGIRDVISSKRQQVMTQYGKNELMVLIKATETANYKNVVDIMDEMLINHVDRYAVVDITTTERAFLK